MDTDSIQIKGQFFNSKDIQKKLKTENLPEWEQGIHEFILKWFDNSDFILQQTSGSTGKPKSIRLKKKAMIASAKTTLAYFNLQKNNTAWLCLPIEYIAGKMMVVRALVGELNLLISSPSGTPKIPDQIVDFTALVPLQMRQLIDSGTDFSNVKQLIIGGAAVDFSLQQAIAHLPVEIYATYGMTETCSHIAIQRLNGTQAESCFHTLNKVAISTNEDNCLQIKAPELTEELLQTNDIVRLLSHNQFQLIGRKDNIINSGGLKIVPEELEREISDLLHADCLIIPIPDKLLGQKIGLVLEGKDKSLSENELSAIKTRVGKHRTPKSVYYVNQFPRTGTMKIDRKKVTETVVTNQ